MTQNEDLIGLKKQKKRAKFYFHRCVGCLHMVVLSISDSVYKSIRQKKCFIFFVYTLKFVLLGALPCSVSSL